MDSFLGWISEYWLVVIIIVAVIFLNRLIGKSHASKRSLHDRRQEILDRQKDHDDNE